MDRAALLRVLRALHTAHIALPDGDTLPRASADALLLAAEGAIQAELARAAEEAEEPFWRVEQVPEAEVKAAPPCRCGHPAILHDMGEFKCREDGCECGCFVLPATPASCPHTRTEEHARDNRGNVWFRCLDCGHGAAPGDVGEDVDEEPAALYAIVAKAQRERERVAELAAAGPRSLSFPMKRGGGTAVVSPDAAKPGRWRVTRLDFEGEPTGHVEAEDFRGALEEARQSGANLLPESPAEAAEPCAHGRDLNKPCPTCPPGTPLSGPLSDAALAGGKS